MSQNAQFYDAAVADWPSEIDFYRELLRDAAPPGGSVLEVACGTGRVAVRLAQDGARVVGLDRSADFLTGARAKSAGLPNVRWEEGDMRAFDLGETFALAIIPGHSFQFMLTTADQTACLRCIQRHLVPGGRPVVHLDQLNMAWLGALRGDKGGVFELTQEVVHPETGQRIQVYQAWTYEPATQTAAVRTRRDMLDDQGAVVGRIERGPTALHCVFPFEMEHLLARADFEIEAVYGDFLRGPLDDGSSEMIWLARHRSGERLSPR